MARLRWALQDEEFEFYLKYKSLKGSKQGSDMMGFWVFKSDPGCCELECTTVG